MSAILTSPRRAVACCGLIICALAAGATSANAGVLLDHAHFADDALPTHWSLPGPAEAAGALAEPRLVSEPPPTAPKAAEPALVEEQAAPPATRTALAIGEVRSRGFTRSDRWQARRTPGDITRLEVAFHVLNAADAISTVACLQRKDCQEQNPIYGKRPSAALVLGGKALTAGVHYWVMRTLLPDHPGMARAFGWFSVTVQGSVVGLNMSRMF